MTNPERIRLAQELHDGIAQDLVGVGYSLDLLLAAPQTPIDTRLQLRTLRFTVTDLVDKVRREMYQLRQPTQLTLAQQLHINAVSICNGLTLSLSIAEVPLAPESELAYEITKIATELLRNVAAHAAATSVSISLSCDDGLVVLKISDNGKGGADSKSSQLSRHGLRGIHERAEAIGARIAIDSDRSGTHACLAFPTP
ncbi:MAG: histidine kinase [Actinomycetota bacterium]